MEKRQSTRLEKTLPVRFDLPDVPLSVHPLTPTFSPKERGDRLAGEPSRIFEALSRNISSGGAFIESDIVQEENFALGEGSPLNLEIELKGGSQRIKPKAEVAWISRKSRRLQKRRNGFGVRFVQLNAQEKRAISVFISGELLTQSEFAGKEISVILREQKLTDKQRRNLEILDTIRIDRLVSRAQISKETDINIVTVSNYIDTYLKNGLVFERGLDISTGGRRPELVEINPRYGYALGVDLGLLNVEEASMRAVATDFGSHLKVSAQEKRVDDNIEESMDALKGLITEVCASDKIEAKKIRGIGIGICGIMDKFGGTVRNPQTRATFANYATIKRELEKEFGLPVFVEGAATCALFAEKWAGINLEAKSADNIIYVFSDEQCAIMLKGELYTGSSKSAGQLNLASSGNDLNSGTDLGTKVAYLINIFNPEVVIIGKNFRQLDDVFLDAIRRTVNRCSFRESANIVRIIPGTLGEEATALGAASLVIEAAFANM